MEKKKHNFTLFTLTIIFGSALFLSNCGTIKEPITISNDERASFEQVEGDTITITSDKTEYEIIIIEPGFNTWLNSIAKPEGYYSQSFLENRNYIMAMEWNRRVLSPAQFNPNLYELQIDYNQNIDYGYGVNYKLYNYFIYFQRKYNQRLGSFIPRI